MKSALKLLSHTQSYIIDLFFSLAPPNQLLEKKQKITNENDYTYAPYDFNWIIIFLLNFCFHSIIVVYNTNGLRHQMVFIIENISQLLNNIYKQFSLYNLQEMNKKNFLAEFLLCFTSSRLLVYLSHFLVFTFNYNLLIGCEQYKIK